MSESPLSRIGAAAAEDAAAFHGPAPEAERKFHDPLKDAVRSLSRAFAASDQHRRDGYSPGDVAQLRRLDHRRGHGSAGQAFWRIVVHELEERGLLGPGAGDDALKAWMALLQGLATVAELHDGRVPLGQAISQAGISEARLTRLLRARGGRLLDQIRPLAHQLRSQAQPANWVDVAQLVLSDGRPWAEEVRRRVASSFYRHQHQQRKSSQPSSP